MNRIKMKKLIWVNLAAVLLAGPFFGKPASATTDVPGVITARSAVKAAREFTKYGQEYRAWYELKTDALNNSYYVIDFVKCDADETFCYFMRRILVKPATGEIEQNKDVLREWQALEGQTPDVFDPVTKIEKERPLDSKLISMREAVKKARLAAGLGNEYGARIALRRDTYDTMRYVIDFTTNPKRDVTLWQKRVLVNPYNGNIETDQEILASFGAMEGTVPQDLNIIGPNRQIISDQEKGAMSVVVGAFLVILLFLLARWIFRKKFADWTTIDYLLMTVTAAIIFLSAIIYSMAPTRIDLALMTFSTAILTLTLWLIHRDMRSMMGIQKNKALDYLPPSKLPTFKEVGGMESVKSEIHNTLGLMLRNPGKANRFKVAFNGVLFYGGPGVGKSFIARATAGEFSLNFISLRISDMTSSYYGGSVKKIDDAFHAARKKAPCLLFLDEIESVGSKRGQGSQLMEDTRITNHLLQCLEDVRKVGSRVFVFAATNKKEDLDEALIRSGRFDKHVHIPSPDLEARKAVLKACLAKRPVSADIDLQDLAARTDGMTAANLDIIANKAGLRAMKEGKTGQGVICQADLLEAIKSFRQVRKESSARMRWDDVIVEESVKSELQRLVKLIENPETTYRLGVKPPKGALLYGPPGTGKTTIARAIASETSVSFISLSQVDIYSKWYGESQQNIRKIFSEAKNVRPAIIFIDEIDAIMSSRGAGAGFYSDQIASQILQEIDGIESQSGIFVIGATNAPDSVDAALIRGGRLSVQIEIDLPSEPLRAKMFERFLSSVNKAADLDITFLAELTDGFSGADIREICDRAILDSYEPDSSAAPVLSKNIMMESIQAYKKNSSAYKVPPHFKKRRIGFLQT